jgi:demethylmenaquinone methyltransferase/2-methoxy-6-polyprenyl-1,4-benzoquinol methylase
MQPPDTDRFKELLRLPVNGNLLEAGGGTGRVCSTLHAYVGNLILTDTSYNMLNKAKQKNLFQVSLAEAERLPYPTESFDRVLVVDAMHHFKNQEIAVFELLRVLKAGGRMVIEEPDINHFSVKLIALAEKLALMRSHFHTPEEIGEFVSRQGYSPKIVRDESISSWIIVDK